MGRAFASRALPAMQGLVLDCVAAAREDLAVGARGRRCFEVFEFDFFVGGGGGDVALLGVREAPSVAGVGRVRSVAADAMDVVLDE